MNFFFQLRIGTRLALSFGLVILMIAGMCVYNAGQIGRIDAMAAEVAGPQAERVALANEWHYNIGVNATRTLAVGLSTGPEVAKQFKEDIAKTTARTSVVQKRFIELEDTPSGKAALAKLAEIRVRYLAARDAMMKAVLAGDEANAAKLALVFRPIAVEYTGIAGEMLAVEQQRGREMASEVEASIQAMQRMSVLTTIGCLLVAAIMGWLLTRSVVRPLAEAEATARRIADGDLSVDLHTTGHDEVARLTASLASMQDGLRTLVGGIRQTVDGIGVASSEVASGNQDLSARTEQSAANLQQTASSVEQISSTVRQSAESAGTARELAATAADVARRGGASVGEIVRTMDGISASSRRIADIIGTVDGIAFQTNILALNAAVEAARAGEQGRGFAVVAGEVRLLAQRSAEAAKEIKVLIADSVGRIDVGSRQVQAAGTTIEEVVASVERVSAIVDEISHTTREQAEGIQEINRAVANLDQATQGNAALVEESAAAASSLKDQAQALAGSVQRFRLRAGEAVAA